MEWWGWVLLVAGMILVLYFFGKKAENKDLK